MILRTRNDRMAIDITTAVPDVPDLPRYPTDADRRAHRAAARKAERATNAHRDAVRAAVNSALDSYGMRAVPPSPAGPAPGYTGWAAACEWFATRDAWTMIGADGCARTFLADVAQRLADARHFGRIDRRERDAANARGYRARKAATPPATDADADAELASLRDAADRASRSKGRAGTSVHSWADVSRKPRPAAW